MTGWLLRYGSTLKSFLGSSVRHYSLLNSKEYRIAGNFRGNKIFVIGACTAGKGRQGRFICG